MSSKDELVISYDDTFMQNFNTSTCAVIATTRRKGKFKYPRAKNAELKYPGR
jgi:hypothetical protein